MRKGFQMESGRVVDGKVKSTCCNSRLGSASGDGVTYGFCESCGESVVRVNPRTGFEEFLDGQSIWSQGDLRPVIRWGDVWL